MEAMPGGSVCPTPGGQHLLHTNQALPLQDEARWGLRQTGDLKHSWESLWSR